MLAPVIRRAVPEFILKGLSSADISPPGIERPRQGHECREERVI